LNLTCQGEILGGIEYVNLAFLTQSGTPIGSPNPAVIQLGHVRAADQLLGRPANLGIAGGAV
jgi:hypothetical protein